MNKIAIALLFLIFGAAFLSAQPIIELLPNDTIYAEIGSDDFAKGDGIVINRSNQRQSYNWKYDIICAPIQWNFSIEDGRISAPPGVDTTDWLGPVFIEPNEELALQIRVMSFEVAGTAQVNVKLYLTQFPDSIAVQGVYIFNDGCQSVGVSNATIEHQVKVYPNPTSGKFQIEVPSDFKIQTAQLFDISGSLKQTFNLKNLSKGEIEINSFLSGIYFLELKLSSGEFIRKKVILN